MKTKIVQADSTGPMEEVFQPTAAYGPGDLVYKDGQYYRVVEPYLKKIAGERKRDRLTKPKRRVAKIKASRKAKRQSRRNNRR
ncbi:hypothetical protein [Vibrio phage vB_VmeM-Yong XC32]|nr:hypothetical protein [Vibrio phage vB_VmeM-Yong XC31]QAX96535.1 hypothetical protein [Vibrio phage vB_VmeM-Yong XC32]QAX96853.1 hypothetical protein [Vibrio phage vB_VmeM-Yong MS31]QAX97158.1 hypothetical protein [Vibrio phage vB_VmeM-Yong MS32]